MLLSFAGYTRHCMPRSERAHRRNRRGGACTNGEVGRQSSRFAVRLVDRTANGLPLVADAIRGHVRVKARTALVAISPQRSWFSTALSVCVAARIALRIAEATAPAQVDIVGGHPFARAAWGAQRWPTRQGNRYESPSIGEGNPDRDQAQGYPPRTRATHAVYAVAAPGQTRSLRRDCMVSDRRVSHCRRGGQTTSAR